jgi:uncharacterized membrane protein
MGRRGVWITLFVSLALNLFLVGAIVGALVIGGRMREVRAEMRRGPGPGLWSAAQGLSPESQRAYHVALRGRSRETGDALRQSREARRAAWARLKAEPFDAAAMQADLDRARALEGQARGGVERRIVEFAATLTPQERVALAEQLARAAPGPRGDGRMRRMGPPPEGGPPGPPPKDAPPR